MKIKFYGWAGLFTEEQIKKIYHCLHMEPESNNDLTYQGNRNTLALLALAIRLGAGYPSPEIEYVSDKSRR